MSLTETFDIEFPLFAFSHCRDVVAAVSRNGGFGVLGAVELNPDNCPARKACDQCIALPIGKHFAIVEQHVAGRDHRGPADRRPRAAGNDHSRHMEALVGPHNVLAWDVGFGQRIKRPPDRSDPYFGLGITHVGS